MPNRFYIVNDKIAIHRKRIHYNLMIYFIGLMDTLLFILIDGLPLAFHRIKVKLLNDMLDTILNFDCVY